MALVFDRTNSAANRIKHGMDFFAAQALRSDSDAIEVPARGVDEPRFLVIGRIGGTHWSAIVTYRGEAIRIISARRSRKREVQFYESQRAR